MGNIGENGSKRVNLHLLVVLACFQLFSCRITIRFCPPNQPLFGRLTNVKRLREILEKYPATKFAHPSSV